MADVDVDVEALAARLDQVDLLLAMYPGEGEVVVDTGLLARAQAWCDGDVGADADARGLPAVLEVVVTLGLDGDGGGGGDVGGTGGQEEAVEVCVEVPVQGAGGMRVRLRQPGWMNRARAAEVNQRVARECLVDGGVDVFAAVDVIREEAGESLRQRVEGRSGDGCVLAASSSSQAVAAAAATVAEKDPLVRVWFYFPSLSTRAKRADLVDSAPAYRLTGFVLAGKPGILCLEGSPRQVDEYMKYIKTESWGDIPSHQKKVSERYREVLEGGDGEGGGQGRVFEDMQEITEQDWMGERRGERGNRSDLRVVEGWLKKKGLDGVLQKVLM